MIPEMYRPASGLWTGFVARSTVLVYNTGLVEESELPASIMELAEPEWAGRLSFSPTGADFQAIVAAILELEGEDATRAWLEGIKENGTVYDGNNVVLESVDSGESEVGIVYHYYWERDREEGGDVQRRQRSVLLRGPGPGRLRERLGRGHPRVERHEGRGRGVHGVPRRRGRAADHRRQLRAGVPAQPGHHRSSRA